MGIPKGAVKSTPVDPGLVQRVSGMIRYMVTGNRPDWFGPLEPLPPVVPAAEAPSVQGRQLDYPVGFNVWIRPRSEERVSFEQMRGLADAYDVLRLVIETRKDQMAKLTWVVKPKDNAKKPDSRCQAIQDFFALPDQFHSWDDWLRMLLEDMFVIDAASLYVRPTQGGQPYAFEPIDGATIKRVIDEWGRTPEAPAPAYQQILHGVPAVDYSRDELIYRPRNARTHKIYGMSPVEQIIMTVNIALRRQIYTLNYYTEGSVPEALASVPKEWNPDQIAQFQAYWDDLISGDLAQRRKLKFIPDGVKYIETKANPLKDDFDEWLARVVCYAFSVPPTAFTKQVNRATAETAQDAAIQEGLSPVMQWVKGLMDFIVAKYFNAPDLEFSWSEEESLDPLEQAKILDMAIRNGSKTINEVREFYGDEPVEGGDDPIIITASGAIKLQDALDQASKPPAPPVIMQHPGVAPDAGKEPPEGNEPKQPAKEEPKAADKEAVAKAKKPISRIDRDRPEIDKKRQQMQASVQGFLNEQKAKIAQQVVSAFNTTAKADDTQDKIQQILDKLNFDGWAVLIGDVEPILEQIAKQGGADALAQINMQDDDKILSLVNEKAVEYAKNRAAELVGMKINADGEAEPNPNAEWQISDSTRDMLRSTVEQAMQDGWSNDRLADEIQANQAFSPERAENIARTETAFADVAGNMHAYRASGVVEKKQWITGEGCCDDCQELDGQTIGLDDFFQGPDGSVDAPPLHPRCRCDVTPIVADDNSEED